MVGNAIAVPAAGSVNERTGSAAQETALVLRGGLAGRGRPLFVVCRSGSGGVQGPQGGEADGLGHRLGGELGVEVERARLVVRQQALGTEEGGAGDDREDRGLG